MEYDELFEHKKEVDECLEVSRALLEMTADNAELNVQLTKRPASNGIRQNASKKTKYVDPSSKSGLLLSGWTRFHRQMADENSELASRAIDFNWETPEEVKSISFKVVKFWLNYSSGTKATGQDKILREFALNCLQEMSTSIMSESFWSVSGTMEVVNESSETFEQRMMARCNN